ncbi:oligosaccharide flippase family protein [Pyruvatibacter sp.]|uniref:oligosaccharide flippase family protein n=1 Tax=Pyruvatibacter sp. TaxID=1981328 RepID=UPI0032EDCE8D
MPQNDLLAGYRTAVGRLAGFSGDAGGQAAFGFLIIALAARASELEAFGTFAFTLALVGLQAPLGVFGLRALIYSRVAARRTGRHRLISIAFWSCLPLSCLLYLGSVFIILSLGQQDLALLYSFCGLKVLAAPAQIILADHEARYAIRDYVPLRIASISFASLAAVWLFMAGEGVEAMALVWGGESVLFALALWAATLKRVRMPRALWMRQRALFYKAAPLAIQTVFVVLYLRFDQIYVQLRFGQAELAIYAAAARIAEAGNLAFGIVVLMLTPYLIREAVDGSLSRRSFVALVAIAAATLFASFSALFFGAAVLRTIFGAPYQPGQTILAIYILSTAFVAYSSMASRIATSLGATGVSALTAAAGAAANIVLSIALGELMGPAGVAGATVLSYALVVALLVSYLKVRSKR